ncbi:Protease II [Candidatus Phaeomarinobacter ectocarpi]|uniref:Protease II n=1 Tax=Candidatus Phaeomarinibacter ectocarpi TaxID=1458461 RepID=X5MA53_9HYPH|nr:S9 family peptidase [Candidatus Phaeomarinobacter ectocarpi]CDO60623.1 Protease II [Candidatus Phaeomarinobacter ectocarpi]
MTLSAPAAARKPTQETHHGRTRSDDYGWLRAENWQQVMREPDTLDPDIRAYLEAENAYTDAQMAPTKALQDTIFGEIKGRIKEDDSSVPSPDGPFAYYSRWDAGAEYPLYCRQPRDGGEETIILDGPVLAEGESYLKIGDAAHSRDHKLLAFSVDTAGSEYFSVSVKNLETGALLADTIPDTSGGVVWADDNATLFYTVQDGNHRPHKVMRHVLGTPVADDVCIYEETDPGFFVGVGQTQSGKLILIDSHDHQTSEIRFIPAAIPDTAPVLIAARDDGHEYDVEEWEGRLIIRTNAANAEDFKLVETPVATPGRENWKDLVPHAPGTFVQAHFALKGHLARLERFGGLPRAIIRDMATGDEHAIAFDEEAYSLGLAAGYEYDTSKVRFTYSSMTTPAEQYDYDMATRERVLLKRQEVPSGHDPSDYVTRRLMATAPDGEQVPVSLIHHKDTPLDGSAPCLLYGYGAYGISIPAGFSVARLSLVDRGFVYAIAHIRGGKDKGYQWYRGGKLQQKPNTFTDFIAAGEHLIAQGFTSKGHIVAQGGSAGGMLMGAVANMRPDLFAGIVAEVPFVDVLATMLDDTLPLTPPEWNEWGNPIADPEAYDWIAAYSPYDNVSAQDYPALFALGGLADPRVTYWEPTKWVAKLRALKTDDNLLMLKTNMEAGHGGKSGRFEGLHEVAEVFAFCLMVTGKA